MKVVMDEKGNLTISPESAIEAFALSNWNSEKCTLKIETDWIFKTRPPAHE